MIRDQVVSYPGSLARPRVRSLAKAAGAAITQPGQVSQLAQVKPVATLGNLQILRLMAAAMVLYGHLNHEVLGKPAMAGGFVPFQPIWWHCGVDVFFVLSGFIMALITRDSFGVSGAPTRFVKARLIRLVPMYWLFTTLTLLAMAVVPGEMRHHTATWRHVLGSYLFVPLELNSDGNPRPVMILGWTLNYEMLFYAIFALAMRLGRQAGLIAVSAAIISLSVIGMMFGLPMPLKVWCNPILLEFLLGIALYEVWQRTEPMPVWAGLVVAAQGFCAMAVFMAAGIANHADSYRVIWGGVPAAMIVAGVLMIREQPEPGPVKRFFMRGGDASYALYLSHPFVLSPVAVVGAKAGLANPEAYILSAFAACLAFSWVFYTGFERPLHQLAGRLLR
jgi:exopolysaccharide production protein ExoZ